MLSKWLVFVMVDFSIKLICLKTQVFTTNVSIYRNEIEDMKKTLKKLFGSAKYWKAKKSQSGIFICSLGTLAKT